MPYPEGLRCALCDRDFVCLWLPDGSAGLCGTCADKAPSKVLKLLAIVTKAVDDFCPYIYQCGGKEPDDFPNDEYCPCKEHSAPCWCYEKIYQPAKEGGFLRKKETDKS